MNEMTDEQKKECRDNWYTRDRNSYFEACDGNCAICTLSYDDSVEIIEDNNE